jgi:hypothetical protein
VVAEVEYMKDGPEGDQFVSALDSVTVGWTDEGEEITSCVIRPIDGPPVSGKKARKLSDDQRLALDALTECVLKSGQNAPAILNMPSVKAVLVDDWREEMFRRNVLSKTDANPRAHFKMLRNSLAARGEIGLHNELVWKA